MIINIWKALLYEIPPPIDNNIEDIITVKKNLEYNYFRVICIN